MIIHVVNGPNLNLLGKREPAIYGTRTLKDIIEELEETAFCNSVQISFLQSNHEGEIIDYLQKVKAEDAVILNAGGLAHTSVCLRDCIAAIEAEVVEVHISNITARETFRQTSLLSPVCKGVIMGLGTDVYRIALEWLIERE
ncbi:MAG TPA: type II 3-dehydroquinate dehydratase [Candidatus Riflebacteria bacterium]|jgi:3-dehydroquinate dehydratase-2|nr:MAG: type II 3-dehydroquinate dehydratase [Candidatus Riflebacteria bacterium HGW-Riflebacteria-1]HAE39852.1 type II 3-dehydroquinate dehydratase [Candidatus Riflebacteria bacterium]